MGGRSRASGGIRTLSDLEITQVCHRYHPEIGGVEQHVQKISEHLAENGCRVEVLTTDPTGELPRVEEINGVTVRRFNSYAPQDSIFRSKSLREYLRENRFEILHAHNYHALPALYAAESRSRIFIFTPHYHGRSQSWIRNLMLYPYRIKGRRIFNRADRVICVSNHEKKMVKEDFSVPEEKFAVILNGIDLSEFEKRLVEKDPKMLLFVGRLEEYKGVQHIIHALTNLPAHHLTIIGRGVYEGKLMKLAERLGVRERITWQQSVAREDLIKAYQRAGVFLMPSRLEAYGITTAEALAAGTPSIVLRGSALEEFIDNETCIGIDPDKDIVRELTDAVQQLSGMHAKRPENVIDWSQVAEETMKLYMDVYNRAI